MRAQPLSIQLHKHPAAFHLHRVGAQGHACGFTGGFASAHVKLSLVQRAFDVVAVHEAVAQACVAMGAGVVAGVDGAANGVDGNVAAGNLNAQHVVGGQVFGRQGVEPGRVVHAVVSF